MGEAWVSADLIRRLVVGSVVQPPTARDDARARGRARNAFGRRAFARVKVSRANPRAGAREALAHAARARTPRAAKDRPARRSEPLRILKSNRGKKCPIVCAANPP